MIRPPFRVEPLGKQHDRAAFSCGVRELDEYLRSYAGQDQKRDLARCFVLIHEDDPGAIIAYYTLTNAAITRDTAPGDLRSPYPEVPALLIGRLAVDRSHQRRGWGRRLLLHVLLHVARLSEESGFALVLVDPISQDAAGFYERFGFKNLPGAERMYLRVKDLRKTLGTA